MIDRKVLEVRKQAQKQIMAALEHAFKTENKWVRASNCAYLASTHGLSRRFSDEYLRLLEEEGVVVLEYEDKTISNEHTLTISRGKIKAVRLRGSED